MSHIQKRADNYTMKDGTVIRVGDMVTYNWGADENGVFPFGFIEYITKEWRRWHATVHLLGAPKTTITKAYNQVKAPLCNFHRNFTFVNQDDYNRK